MKRTSSFLKIALVLALFPPGILCLLLGKTLFGKKVSMLQSTGVQLDSCRVKSVTRMVEGTAPDWSWDGQLIAYQDMVDKSYEIFIMNADGSDSHCLTCGNNTPQEFSRKHKGKATFHPNGKYLLFSVENEHGNHGLATLPGIGDNHDLWVTDLENGSFWRLTKLPRDAAIQYPRFSSDGTKLLWSQRYEKDRFSILKKGREFGFWTMRLADFITDDGPALSDIVDLEPGGKGFYEPHGFTPDGRTIIFTAMIQPGKSAFYGAIYTLDLATNEMTTLAQTDDIHYEMAVYSPGGCKISYMSGPFIGVLQFGYEADLYLMDKDGGNRLRLTYFNEPGHPDYAGAPCQIDKEAWSPDGNKIVSAYHNHRTRENTVFMLAFEGPCGRCDCKN